MNENIKKTILIDLDGVLNTYTGDFNKEIIPPIRKGARKFLMELSDKYKIKIFTNRNLLLASKWIIKHKLSKYIEDVTNIKELSYLQIDDSCINFRGSYSA